MVIRHGEAFGISERWTVWQDGKAGLPPDRPLRGTCPAMPPSRPSRNCAPGNYELQPKLRIMSDREIVSGADILGALLMGHPYKSWWTGSILSIQEARKLAPGQNATTIQVALGIVSRGDVDDRAPEERVLPPGRPAARVRARHRQTLPRRILVRALRLDAPTEIARSTSRRTRRTTTIMRISGNSKTSYSCNKSII